MTPEKAYELLRIAIPLRPELRYSIWPKVKKRVYSDLGPYEGACYIATQVFCEFIPEARPYCDLNRDHFWAQIGDEIFDPTFDQFYYVYNYDQGHKTKFKQFSKRANELLKECLLVEFTNS